MTTVHAAYYADQALQQVVVVEENRPLARDTFRLRCQCPEIARRIVPGQFLMLRLAGFDDPLIGRPFALYDTVCSAHGEPWGVDIVYLVGGKLTRRLAQVAVGQQVEMWGPLGNGFPVEPIPHLIMVAGGIGQTPFVALAKEYLGQHKYGEPPRDVSAASRVTLCYGARTADLLAGAEDFRRAGVEVHVATDDGSQGHHGLVTEILKQVLETTELPRRIVCCGPEAMMEAVADIAVEAGVPCQVSLETPMACGIGICFTCVTKLRQSDGTWDYKRTCVDGPVFEARDIVW